MRILCLIIMILNVSAVSAAMEKDLNLGRLKKAHHWLVKACEDESLLEADETPTEGKLTGLSNIENVWDVYKSFMKRSIVIVRKYPRKVSEKLSTLFNQENSDILPLVAFYLYSAEKSGEKKDKTLRYYDAFNTHVVPANQDNVWVGLIPFTDNAHPTVNDYSVIILDVNNQRILIKD